MSGNKLTVKVSLLAMFSVLAFIAAIIVKLTVSYGAIVYAIVLLVGVLTLREPYGATAISLIAGLLYSFQSALFLLIVGAFLVRGVTIDVLFNLLGVYKRKEYRVWAIVATMVVSSFLAGIYQYLFLVLLLKKLVDFGAFIVSTIFLVALASNALAGYLVPKYVMPRIEPIMRW